VDTQLKAQAARLGFEQYDRLLQEAQTDLEALAATIEQETVKLTGLSTEIDHLQREIQSLGAVNLAALEELGTARERKTFLGCAVGRLERSHQHAWKMPSAKLTAKHVELLGDTFETVNQHFGKYVPRVVWRWQRQIGDDWR
jgi:chromosome segregation protein